MKDSIIILTGGGPAPGMNTVVGTITQAFVARGYRVIGLHGGYEGLFREDAEIEEMDFSDSDRGLKSYEEILELARQDRVDLKLLDKAEEEDVAVATSTDDNAVQENLGKRKVQFSDERFLRQQSPEEFITDESCKTGNCLT